jgi:hypothetical protein
LQAHRNWLYVNVLSRSYSVTPALAGFQYALRPPKLVVIGFGKCNNAACLFISAAA